MLLKLLHGDSRLYIVHYKTNYLAIADWLGIHVVQSRYTCYI